MISTKPEDDPETVNFLESCFAEGPVEGWLMNIQNMMVKTLWT